MVINPPTWNKNREDSPCYTIICVFSFMSFCSCTHDTCNSFSSVMNKSCKGFEWLFECSMMDSSQIRSNWEKQIMFNLWTYIYIYALNHLQNMHNHKLSYPFLNSLRWFIRYIPPPIPKSITPFVSRPHLAFAGGLPRASIFTPSVQWEKKRKHKDAWNRYLEKYKRHMQCNMNMLNIKRQPLSI